MPIGRATNTVRRSQGRKCRQCDSKTRRPAIELLHGTSSAGGLWMAQIARNLTDAVDGFLSGKKYLIHDRDPLYTKEFLSIIGTSGIEPIKLPPRSPNLNAY